ncbi:hypothetical protein EV702DRAFT_1044440 [Suillus placidus]|uniref:Uncharacterized protein n=1 Tax=Suillus placidus TaxID=48579 RepID=A0A9P7D4U2_9AGAM|nr:hypothetical protein EV702DRAFT_1044440 [Suillus placidus]
MEIGNKFQVKFYWVIVVTFFNGSHYWGGQLKEQVKVDNVKHGLKKNFSCNPDFWAAINQGIKDTKSIVNLIGDKESCEFSLASFANGCSFKLLVEAALDVAKQWRWEEQVANCSLETQKSTTSVVEYLWRAG